MALENVHYLTYNVFNLTNIYSVLSWGMNGLQSTVPCNSGHGGVIFPTTPVFLYILCNFLIEEKQTVIN